MRRLITILILSASLVTFAQERTFLDVDTSTYRQYMKGDWLALIENGEDALDKDVDYYYLQMRIGYAYFSLNKYRKAAVYYKNALEHNSRDAIAHEYLYYSYLNAGRDGDAQLQSQYLNATQKERIGIQDSINFVSIGLYYTFGNSNAENLLQSFEDYEASEDGVQKAGLVLHTPQIGFAHKVGRKITLHHQGSYLKKSEMANIVDAGITYLSPDQIIRQYEYALDIDFVPADGWLIRPGVHFLNTTLPLFQTSDYGSGAGQNRIPVDYRQIQNRAYKMYVEKQFPLLSGGLSYVYHEFNHIRTQQLGIHTSIYPFYNLNFYVSANIYGQRYDTQSLRETGMVVQSIIGGKVLKNLWLEVNMNFPENMGFYDIQNSIAYNSLEKNKYKFGLSAIVPLYKINTNFYLSYKYNGNLSYFFPEADPLLVQNKQLFNTHIITGGIKWKI